MRPSETFLSFSDPFIPGLWQNWGDRGLHNTSFKLRTPSLLPVLPSPLLRLVSVLSGSCPVSKQWQGQGWSPRVRHCRLPQSACRFYGWWERFGWADGALEKEDSQVRVSLAWYWHLEQPVWVSRLDDLINAGGRSRNRHILLRLFPTAGTDETLPTDCQYVLQRKALG